jgi:LuxR family maltose regulon positive regulatory protein
VHGLSVDAELSYLHEFEHITLARILLTGVTAGHPDRAIGDAVGFLERLLQAAEAGGRTGSVIEILVLLALAHQVDGDLRAAIIAIERAVRLAEPDDHVRIFVDAGQPMAVLLGLMKQRIAPAYVRRLLSVIGSGADHARANQTMVEPLSERELDVLRLLATDLDGPDIAGELVLSLNTVRTHTKNIYAKLGVNNRRAAVRRAVELDVL